MSTQCRFLRCPHNAGSWDVHTMQVLEMLCKLYTRHTSFHELEMSIFLKRKHFNTCRYLLQNGVIIYGKTESKSAPKRIFSANGLWFEGCGFLNYTRIKEFAHRLGNTNMCVWGGRGMLDNMVKSQGPRNCHCNCFVFCFVSAVTKRPREVAVSFSREDKDNIIMDISWQLPDGWSQPPEFLVYQVYYQAENSDQFFTVRF